MSPDSLVLPVDEVRAWLGSCCSRHTLPEIPDAVKAVTRIGCLRCCYGIDFVGPLWLYVIDSDFTMRYIKIMILGLARIFHDSAAPTVDMAVFPGVPQGMGHGA